MSIPIELLFGLASSGVCTAIECYHSCGELLPHLFTLTLSGIFSAALSVNSRLPGVTWRLAHEVRTFLWNFQRSSDQLGTFYLKKIFLQLYLVSHLYRSLLFCLVIKLKSFAASLGDIFFSAISLISLLKFIDDSIKF